MIKVAEFVEMHKQGKVPAATMIKMAAFRNELENSKIATSLLNFVKADMKTTIPHMISYGGGLGIGALIYEGIRKLEKSWTGYKLDSTKEPLFQQMLKLHPELKADQQTQDRAALYFDSLWHFSPSVAQDPLAAGSYIKQALQMHNVAQGPLPDLLKNMTEIQKNIKAGTSDSEYSTPLGAVFLPFKPQGGGLYKSMSSSSEIKTDPNQLSFFKD